ncbi:MAG: hypothetical protein ACRDBO_02270 [Lachnospiraceae bacterium]
MNKTIKRAVILLLIFVAAVMVYFILNRDSLKQDNAMYMSMENPQLPVIYTEIYGRKMNAMYGYRQEMGNAAARDSLTILPEDRGLDIHITRQAQAVLGLRYEIRSLDLDRLVENTSVENWEQQEDGVTATLPIQNLLTKDREYLLRIEVDTENYGTAYYYTRIIWTDNEAVQPMIDLAVDFSSRTFRYEDARELVTYLETNATEDNSSFGRTTIRSSFSQLTWGRLKMEPAGDVQVTLKELDGLMGCVQLNYLASRQGENGGIELYEVEENFTMKWNSLRIYMMDYERTLNQVFQGDPASYSGKRIMLGITNDSEVRVKKSTNNQMLAFLINRELWCYDQSEERSVQIFSFRTEDSADMRGNYDQHEIEILQVQDNGDVDFLVYGYMNRGRHEGDTGVACYRYDASSNAIAERFFVPIRATYEEIKLDLKQLANINSSDMLYLYLNHAIYGIDLTSNEYMVVADTLIEDSYSVSADKTRIAWQEGGGLYEADTLHLLDLGTGEKKVIQANDGERVRVIGFVGNDLVYGLARETDLWVVNGRTVDLPMYALEIMNSEMKVETRYENSGSYIAGVSVEESRIHLNKVMRLGDRQFTRTEQDTIVCNVGMGPDALAGIGWYASPDKGKLYFVQVDMDIHSNRDVKISSPKRVSYDHTSMLDLKSQDQIQEVQFYAYGGGHLLGKSGDFNEVLDLAYDSMGVVTDQDHNMIWSRVNRGSTRNLRDIATAAAPLYRHLEEFTGSKSYSDGITMLDARGCSMMQVLYFIDQGIPVIAYTDEGSYLLLTGFDQYNVTVYNPSTKETTKEGLNDATEYLRLRGNDFVCAIQSN